ncbi:MAG: aminotransferase class V-fold PLP-dependent enzyme [Actinomycetota bacterium]|nr:aminotransferase class V-fold PLP-dependent enzyme [Actinomycetota bacterium]
MLAALNPPARYLLGPGPSPVEPSVLAAMGKPLLGYDDPQFLRIVDDVGQGLRLAFRTSNPLTLALPGATPAGMDAALTNLVEPGDSVVVGINGTSGERMADLTSRVGGRVTKVTAPWGQVLPTDQLAEVAQRRRAKLVALAQAEDSTGVLQPLEQLRGALGEDPLLVVDAVASLGGTRLEVDAWGIDVCYSATEACLSVPPGLAPITFSRRAEELLVGRLEPVQSWYLDLARFGDTRDGGRAALPVSLIYGLHEGLRLLVREGLEARWNRHFEAGRFLQESLEELGFHILARPADRLPQISVALLPDGVGDELRQVLLDDFDIAVGAGLGELAGRAWRIGLLGFGARREHALRLLQALRALLSVPGRRAR